MMMNAHDAWEKIHTEKEWGRYPSEHVIRFIARNYYARNRGDVKILDFGCGTGANTWFLAREGFDTYAFDISETAIKKLKERMAAESLRVTAIAADGLSLPYEDNQFDVVIDWGCILANPLADIKKMYRKCNDLLIPGGKLMTLGFSKNTTGYGTGREIEPGTFDGLQAGPLQRVGVRHFFEYEELKDCLSEAGFKRVQIETSEHTDNGSRVSQWIAFAEK